MPLLGKGALVIWHTPEPEAETDYNEWHSKEHMFERVGVPGFRRGQRGVAISGSPQYFNLYEVDDVETLSSKAYLDRLNEPSPWTRRVVPRMHDNSRTLCRVTASFGPGGPPAFWTMILLTPEEGRADGLRTWLAGEVLPELIKRPGVLGASMVEGERTTSGTDTAEKRLRDGTTEMVDWVLLIGGYDSDVLAALRTEPLAEASLASHGAASSSVRGIYRVVHCVGEADLPG